MYYIDPMLMHFESGFLCVIGTYDAFAEICLEGLLRVPYTGACVRAGVPRMHENRFRELIYTNSLTIILE